MRLGPVEVQQTNEHYGHPNRHCGELKDITRILEKPHPTAEGRTVCTGSIPGGRKEQRVVKGSEILPGQEHRPLFLQMSLYRKTSAFSLFSRWCLFPETVKIQPRGSVSLLCQPILLAESFQPIFLTRDKDAGGGAAGHAV